MRNFHINRRNFLKGTAATIAMQALGMRGIDLINQTPLRVGLIGTGWYGKSDIFRLIQVAPVKVVSLCDVDQKQLNAAAKLIGERTSDTKSPRLYSDYRKMLAEKDLDLVLIGTPDHWHALQMIEAVKAGAHVYVQKPTSVDVLEGEAMVAAARKYDRVVQVGTQRRSTPHLVDAKRNIIDAGRLGKVGHVEMCCYYHMRANGNPAVQPIPDHLNYDMWTGPAPLRPYDGLPHRGWWRTFMEYSNGIMGDMCVHMFDAVRWMLDLGWPTEISSTGGIYVQKDGKSNTPDTQNALFKYDGFNCIWQHRSWGPPVDPDYPWSFTIYGEKGTLKGSVKSFDFIPHEGEPIHQDCLFERERYPEDLTEDSIELHAAPATRGHMLDLLNAIDQNSKPVADILEGHISSASCILANISMQLQGRPLRYDPVSRKVLGDEEATSLLSRTYRKPWQHPDPEHI